MRCTPPSPTPAASPKEELKVIADKSKRLGAASHATLDITGEYYDKSIRYMIAGNVLRNGTYPISVSSERIFQAIATINYAKKIGADAIAHGSTGAGNDQVRFDLTFRFSLPRLRSSPLPATSPLPANMKSTI